MTVNNSYHDNNIEGVCYILKFIVQLKMLMVITYNADGLKVCEGNVMTYALYCFQLF